MKTWKKVLLAIAVLPVAFIAFSIWYFLHYSMDKATPYEVNNPSTKEHVLVATQGSAFKDAVVEGVVAKLKTRPAYVKVVDVSALETVRESDWNAIVILHTWEGGKPPAPVRTFIDRAEKRDKVVVLSTSGDGSSHIAGVDAITSASKKADAPSLANEIVKRVEKVLGAQSPQTSLW